MKQCNLRKAGSYNLYLILSFISQLCFSLIFTVNLLYQVKTARLNPLELVLVGTILEVSIFLFEIPTGIVADTNSRKLSIIIGYSLMGVGFIIEGTFPYFVAIAISQFFWGIGYTFTSGATEAWIVDEIGEDKAGEVFIKGAQWGQFGELIAVPISVLVALISLNIPIIVGGISMIFISFFLKIFMEENGFKPTEAERRNSFKAMFKTIKSTAYYIKINHFIILLLAIGLFYGLYSEGFDRLWTAHLVNNFGGFLIEKVNPAVLIGVIRAISILLSITALQLLNRKLDFKKKNLVIRVLIFSAICIVITLIAFGLITNLYGAVLLFWIIGIMRSVTSPLLDTWLNKLIDNQNVRATIFSVRGQVDAIGQVAGGPIIGAVGTLFSIRIALVVSGIMLSPVILIYKVVTKKGKEIA